MNENDIKVEAPQTMDLLTMAEERIKRLIADRDGWKNSAELRMEVINLLVEDKLNSKK